MANIVVTDASNTVPEYDLSNFDISNVTVVSATGSTFTVRYEGITAVFKGTFAYNGAGVPADGSTIQSISLRYDGTEFTSITGLSLTYQDLAQGDLESVLETALGGNDSYTSAYNGGEYIRTYGGNDTIKAGSGQDTINGGSGHDTYVISNPADGLGYGFDSTFGFRIYDAQGQVLDYLYNVETVKVGSKTLRVQEGGDGADLLTAKNPSGTTSRDIINGREGNDTIRGGHKSDVLLGWTGEDNIHGGAQYDFIAGGFDNDHLSGGSGSDKVWGEYGSDKVYGGTGNDTLVGGQGSDSLYGGLDNDTLKGDDTYSSHGHDQLYGGRGNDRLEGHGGNDSLYGGKNHDTIYGGSGDDVLYGETGHDTLQGGTGNDTLRANGGDDYLSGGSGNDLIEGGVGHDTLYGRSGSDTLRGQAGDDQLHGGTGADVFIFHRGYGNDTIQDFTAGQDHIKIGVGANGMDDLEFQTRGDDVLVSFSNVTILVEDITLAQLQDADNFLF
ncbi:MULTISPECIES: calcium-binding protein [unclassified Leisingera]|nr:MULTISPECIES: calcium-binding protein [unclassified Leisingera]KIC25329.1 hypothetical protein RA23_05505 [Leisingera sp. ANG-S3]KIC54619.1 hypothetical protein RA22_04545 [Leisingera sp. ANG-S]